MKAKIVPILLSLLAAGCAAPGVDTRGKDGAPPKFFTPIATQSRWTVPAELEGTDSVIVALVDLDFSKRDTEIVCTPASFRPDGNTIRLAVFEEGRRVRTIAALRDVLAERTDGTPIGLVVTANGEALGAGVQITPSMQQFLAYFVDQLDMAGVEFTILAPDRLSVVRSGSADDFEDDAETEAVPMIVPTSKPAPKPVTKPVSKPAVKPVATPAPKPDAKPVSKPNAKPATKPASKHSAKPASKPSAKPASKPTAKPSTKPASKHSAKPASKPSAKPASKPSAKPASKPSAKPASKPPVEPESTPHAMRRSPVRDRPIWSFPTF